MSSTVIVDGKVFVVISDNELNTNWLVAARLMKKAEAGDKEAAKELKKMSEAKTVIVE
jgi:hypothetical protein